MEKGKILSPLLVAHQSARPSRSPWRGPLPPLRATPRGPAPPAARPTRAAQPRPCGPARPPFLASGQLGDPARRPSRVPHASRAWAVMCRRHHPLVGGAHSSAPPLPKPPPSLSPLPPCTFSFSLAQLVSLAHRSEPPTPVPPSPPRGESLLSPLPESIDYQRSQKIWSQRQASTSLYWSISNSRKARRSGLSAQPARKFVCRA